MAFDLIFILHSSGSHHIIFAAHDYIKKVT